MSTPHRRSIDYLSCLGIQGPPRQYKHHPISNYLVVKPPFTCRLNGAISTNMLTCAMHTPCIFFYIKNYIYLITKVPFDHLGYHEKSCGKYKKKTLDINLKKFCLRVNELFYCVLKNKNMKNPFNKIPCSFRK